MRLNKFLAHTGLCSRRESEKLIEAGKISINGKKVFLPQTLVDPEKDIVKFDSKALRIEKKVYYILNKPKSYTCSNKRKDREKLVIDLFADSPHRLFTVGRLDRDTTGLIIVTNDGEFANKVIHPSANHDKEYLVKVKTEITADSLKIISKGALIENKWIKPKKVVKMRRGTLKVTVREGKKREVRILVSNAELDIVDLKRIRIGNLTLGSIPIGSYKQMSEKEKSLFL